MANKIFPILLALFSLLCLAQAASIDKNELPEVLFIENPDTVPAILSPQEALLGPVQRNRICTAALCARVCASLGFRFSRCNANKICVCRN